MPVATGRESLVLKSIGLLVVCPDDLQEAVSEYVTQHADSFWQQKDDITVLAIPCRKIRDRAFVASEINRIASRAQRDLRLLALREVVIDEAKLRNQLLLGSADLGLTLKRFGRSALPDALKGLRLDWRDSIADSLANAWDHGVVDGERIDSWLKQFDALQSHGWVGERLLRVLDFWPSSRIRTRLENITNLLDGYDCICVNRQEAGKSADVMANKIQKLLNDLTTFKVTDFRNELMHTGHAHLMYFEDCLLTGTEITKVLTSLLDKVALGRKAKVEPLKDTDRLREKTVLMHFLLSTNFGCEVLKHFLLQEGLTNIQLAVPDGDIVTLTEAGIRALSEETLFDAENCVADLTHVVQVAFQKRSVWGEPERINRAVEFCSEIGQQLFRQYLTWKGWTWAERRIRESGLGVRGVAMALAFAHSVPKATLPLFWMHGPVRLGNAEVEWLPLFPSAK